jgi:hypothetical protein
LELLTPTAIQWAAHTKKPYLKKLTKTFKKRLLKKNLAFQLEYLFLVAHIETLEREPGAADRFSASRHVALPMEHNEIQ